MLSRKRCRGTLQDYNKGEISECQSKLWTNRNVFSWCLNGTREETVRRDGGRLWWYTSHNITNSPTLPNKFWHRNTGNEQSIFIQVVLVTRVLLCKQNLKKAKSDKINCVTLLWHCALFHECLWVTDRLIHDYSGSHTWETGWTDAIHRPRQTFCC